MRIATVTAAVAELTSCTAESTSEPASVPGDVEVVEFNVIEAGGNYGWPGTEGIAGEYRERTVLGTGMVGRALAGRLVGPGHDVVIGTRDVDQTLARTRRGPRVPRRPNARPRWPDGSHRW